MMEKAIEIAKLASGEIPVGAVIACGDEVIASAHNQKEALNDVTAHAEILAIRAASQKLGRWRLDDCTMYVTLEPCPMCAWAINNARLKAIYFGSYDAQYGALGSAMDFANMPVYGGIMENECNALLEGFFGQIRT
jgi:tRNA(adenine34) deaminase